MAPFADCGARVSTTSSGVSLLRGTSCSSAAPAASIGCWWMPHAPASGRGGATPTHLRVRARPTDAVAIGAVHVSAWRSAYPGILPDNFLARLSVPRQASHYDGAIRSGTGVYVASASGLDVPTGSGPRIIGFATAGRARLTD